MHTKTKTISLLSVILVLLCSACSNSKQPDDVKTATNNESLTQQMNIKIILGSDRKGRTSDKIGNAIKRMADKRSDITTEILDLRDFNVPFFNEEISPASRKSITDPIIKRWSDTILEADAFIIVVPEYNSGYPGVLKNALDSLYKEWNNKPVAFVGFSGGPSGGANAIAQLRQVAQALEMTTIALDIKIPTAWKAFDKNGNLLNQTIENVLNQMIDQLIRNDTIKKSIL